MLLKYGICLFWQWISICRYLDFEHWQVTLPVFSLASLFLTALLGAGIISLRAKLAKGRLKLFLSQFIGVYSDCLLAVLALPPFVVGEIEILRIKPEPCPLRLIRMAPPRTEKLFLIQRAELQTKDGFCVSVCRRPWVSLVYPESISFEDAKALLQETPDYDDDWNNWSRVLANHIRDAVAKMQCKGLDTSFLVHVKVNSEGELSIRPDGACVLPAQFRTASILKTRLPFPHPYRPLGAETELLVSINKQMPNPLPQQSVAVFRAKDNLETGEPWRDVAGISPRAHQEESHGKFPESTRLYLVLAFAEIRMKDRGANPPDHALVNSIFTDQPELKAYLNGTLLDHHWRMDVLKGHRVPINIRNSPLLEETAKFYDAAAALGSREACYRLASLLENQPEYRVACSLLYRFSAKSGYVRAIRKQGQSLIDNGAYNQGVGLLIAAAKLNDYEAILRLYKEIRNGHLPKPEMKLATDNIPALQDVQPAAISNVARETD